MSIAGYALKDAYTPSNFFDMFNFFTGDDPTQGTGEDNRLRGLRDTDTV